MTATTKAPKALHNRPIRVALSKATGQLGRIGKALLFPIAMLPIAAILLRIGNQIPTDTAFSAIISGVIANCGNAVFAGLPVLFAVGVGFGLTKDNRGEAALAALVGMLAVQALMMKSGADLTDKFYGTLHHTIVNGNSVSYFHNLFNPGGLHDAYDSILSGNVLTGIIAGGIVAFIYNRCKGTDLPAALGFFSGRRLIPVLTILAIMFFGFIYAAVWPWVGAALYYLSDALGQAQGNRYANSGIMLVYGIINRLLIPFGLHHIPNTLFWFTLGSHPQDSLGHFVNGDINIFLSGVAEGNHAGTFQSGFFPIMMFGLPALAAAFYFTAEDKEQKKYVFAMFGSAALISFLSGITEPIEFAFLFIAPALFGLHAILTGIFGFITGMFGIQLGFGFSAGLLDYVLSIPKSMDIIRANYSAGSAGAIMANPGWIFVIGAVAAATYFFLGKFLIKRFNISTPGRGAGKLFNPNDDSVTAAPSNAASGLSAKAAWLVEGFGGYENITGFQNCATRLRYDVVDADKIDETKLKKGGAIGVMKVSKTHVQVVIGPKVELVNNEISENAPRRVAK